MIIGSRCTAHELIKIGSKLSNEQTNDGDGVLCSFLDLICSIRDTTSLNVMLIFLEVLTASKRIKRITFSSLNVKSKGEVCQYLTFLSSSIKSSGWVDLIFPRFYFRIPFWGSSGWVCSEDGHLFECKRTARRS